MLEEIAAMNDEELLAEYEATKLYATEKTPDQAPKGWSGKRIERNGYVREEMQRRGATLINGEWVLPDQD